MHGGNWPAYQRQTGSMPLDFSANISPLGVPEKVKQAIRQAAEEVCRYPDPLCRDLREAIGEAEQLPPEYVFCGNGAADLIWRLASVLRNGTVLLPVPAFTEYRAALEAHACQVQPYVLREEDEFRLTERFLPLLQQQASGETAGASGLSCGGREDAGNAVFLCEPGNPSGVTTDPVLLQKILECCAQTGRILVLDECFLDFLGNPEEHTMKRFLKEFPNLILLRALTKSYAMAGVRLGYCLCSDPQLLDRMRQSGQPWNVSHIAQQAGIAALHDKEYLEKVRQLIPREREKLKSGLEKLGFLVIPGEANFLLFRAARKRVEGSGVREDKTPVPYEGGRLAQDLYEKGILIRDCADYEGLCGGWYRICVSTEEENRMFLQVLEQVIQSRL